MKNTRNTIILLLLALAQFLVVTDSAIINVALPAMQQALHISDSNLQWVVTSYLLTFGGFLLLGGRAADLFGRRRMLIAGIVGFSFFSLLLGLTSSGSVLIALRALQGLAAAFMAPAALSILLTTFPEGPARNKALGVWTLVASGGVAAGVFLGGFITQNFGWQWNFFVNVPLGVIAIIGIMRVVPAYLSESEDKNIDIPGALLVTSGLMVLVYALTLAVEAGWTSGSTLGLFGLSLALLIGFVANEVRAKHPLMPLSIFQERNIISANLMMLPVMAGCLGLFFFSSLYLQNVLQYTPLMSGLAFLPIPIVIGILSASAPKILARFALKPVLIAGISSMALGTFLLSLLTQSSPYLFHLLPAFVLMGGGLGLSFMAITVAATSGVPADKSGLAAGLINTTQQIGGALGIAVLAVVASATSLAATNSGREVVQAALAGYKQAFLWATGSILIALCIATFTVRTPKNEVVQEAPTAL